LEFPTPEEKASWQKQIEELISTYTLDISKKIEKKTESLNTKGRTVSALMVPDEVKAALEEIKYSGNTKVSFIIASTCPVFDGKEKKRIYGLCN